MIKQVRKFHFFHKIGNTIHRNRNDYFDNKDKYQTKLLKEFELGIPPYHM